MKSPEGLFFGADLPIRQRGFYCLYNGDRDGCKRQEQSFQKEKRNADFCFRGSDHGFLHTDRRLRLFDPLAHCRPFGLPDV